MLLFIGLVVVLAWFYGRDAKRTYPTKQQWLTILLQRQERQPWWVPWLFPHVTEAMEPDTCLLWRYRRCGSRVYGLHQTGWRVLRSKEEYLALFK